MGQPVNIDTEVHGSPSMLHEGAAALRKAADSVRQANNANHTARSLAYSPEWEGDSNEAFLREFVPSLQTVDELGQTCHNFAKAFDDLGHSIQSVRDNMGKIVDRARAGGLKTEGPIIMRPEKPDDSLKPNVSEATDPKKKAHYGKAVEKWNGLVQDYNTKIQTFNACLGDYVRERKTEQQAHTDFEQATHADKGFSIDPGGHWKIGSTTMSKALTTVSKATGVEKDLVNKMNALPTGASVYQKIADGQVPLTGLTQAERDQLLRDHIRTKADGAAYQRQLTQIQSVSKYVPSVVKKVATAYPGKKSLNLENVDLNSPMGKQIAKGVLSKFGYVGTAMSGFTEAQKVASGEESWGKAVFDVGMTTGGSAAGGGALAAECSPLFPPWGSVVCGVAGSSGGSVLAGEIADAVWPPNSPYPQESEPMPGGTGN